MQKGIVIIRDEIATPELRAQAALLLRKEGWICQLRERFDGVFAVAFEAEDDRPDIDADAIESLLREGSPLLASLSFEIKVL